MIKSLRASALKTPSVSNARRLWKHAPGTWISSALDKTLKPDKWLSQELLPNLLGLIVKVGAEEQL